MDEQHKEEQTEDLKQQHIYCGECFQQKYKFICSRCKCGFYCSKKCQRNDWSTHKPFCKLWNKTGKFNNPFYTDKAIDEPKLLPMILISSNEEEDKDKEDKDKDKDKDKEYNKQYLSYARDICGETQLHIAVVNGDIHEIKHLINNNICINAYDSRHNDALYYACSHSGKDNVLKNNIKLRDEIVELLLNYGANPHQRGGFSGMRPYEICAGHGYDSTQTLIMNHKYFTMYELLRGSFNSSTPPHEISELVKEFHYLFWINESLHWVFMPNRTDMFNVKPHPKIVEQITTFNCTHDVYDEESKIMIEKMFVDYQLRHKRFVAHMNEYVNKQ
jgi:hypothetical protein